MSILPALCLAAACAFVACTRAEDIIGDGQQPQESRQPEEPAEISFTASLAPMDGGTRVIADDNGTTEWKRNEKIALWYETTDTDANGNPVFATAQAKVESVEENGVATISATVSGSAKDNGTAKFVYPASLHDGNGGIDESILLNGQNGILRQSNASISSKYDAATGTGRISVSGTTASVSGSVKMVNQVCICKFQMGVMDGDTYLFNTPMNNDLTITVDKGGEDEKVYTISSLMEDPYATVPPGEDPTYRGFQTNDAIYVAMLPFENKTLTFEATGTISNETYLFKSVTNSGTLQKGKFYRSIPVKMKKGEITNTIISGSRRETVTIPAGRTLLLENAAISVTNGPGIRCEGDATIILQGTSSVTSTGGCGIQAGPSNTRLTIQGNGTITATGGMFAAGIGSGYDGFCGTIIISGGTITATGGQYAAGIGSGHEGFCETIRIEGGLERLLVTSGGQNCDPIKGASVTIDKKPLSEWTPGRPTTSYNWVVSSVNSCPSWTLTHK